VTDEPGRDARAASRRVPGELRFPAAFPVLRSERLVLDAVREGDEPALFGIFRDEQAMRYWSTTAWPDARPATVLIERARELHERGEAIRWALRRAPDAPLLGTATLFGISAANRRAELGYILGREHWGSGLMHEALAAILEWAFAVLGLHRVEADTDPRNAASLALLERLGFVREGLLRERWIVGGEVAHSVLLGLLAADWRAAHGG
jgi:RimJ/RimL family protein N-acetyltransferase